MKKPRPGSKSQAGNDALSLQMSDPAGNSEVDDQRRCGDDQHFERLGHPAQRYDDGGCALRRHQQHDRPNTHQEQQVPLPGKCSTSPLPEDRQIVSEEPTQIGLFRELLQKMHSMPPRGGVGSTLGNFTQAVARVRLVEVPLAAVGANPAAIRARRSLRRTANAFLDVLNLF